jgi:hypothetical protein
LIWLRIGLESPSECGIEPPGSIIHAVKHTGNKALGKSRRRWEDKIIMYFKEIGNNTRNSGQDTHYRRVLVNAALNLRSSISHGVN